MSGSSQSLEEVGFLLLKNLDLLFNRSLRDERKADLLRFLSEAMQSVDGLLLGSLVPPWLEDKHGVGGREVETHTPRLERHEHHAAIGIGRL